MKHPSARAQRRSDDDLLSQALACQQAQDFEAAEKLYHRFLASQPTHLVALNNAGIVAKALGKHGIALVRFGKAVRHYPDAAEAHYNLGNTLRELDRLKEAAEAYGRAVALRPDYVKAHQNLGIVLARLNNGEEAIACYLRALSFGGDNAEIHVNLAKCYEQRSQRDQALAHFARAVALEPERAEFCCLLGKLHFEFRHMAEAIAALRRALKLDPAHHTAASALLYCYQMVCEWDETQRLLPVLRALTDQAIAAGKPSGEGALENLSRDADPRRNLLVTRAFTQSHPAATRGARPHRPARKPHGPPLRIGYLSGDFCDHPVAHVMGGVFARHDRTRFTIIAYSCGEDDGSALRRRIARDCDRFVDIRAVSDDRAIEQLRDDTIDILVDLTVWTGFQRASVCAARPAPVQAQFLGFPGTSAAPFYDYAIVDRIVVPPEHREFFTESLVFMPHSYFPVDRDQPIASTGLNRADCGLPERGIVFCCFNQGYKIEPVVFSAWMQILAEIPDSVMWLSCGHGTLAENLAGEAWRRGVDPSRLVFANRVADKSVHLERLALADVVLDTFAYNGHTSTTDALWAGVPVVAMLGSHFASRVSASLLTAAGREDLVAHDVQSYVQLALRLARDTAFRQSVRSHLLAARTGAPLFNTDRSVATLEQAFEAMWARHCAGDRPGDVFL